MVEPRILVIEDDLLIGLETISTLEAAGFKQVEHAPTEVEALRRLRSESWDVVLADANLNGRNLDSIARLLHQRRIPFAVLTGYDVSSLPASVGPVHVLNKPFSPSEVVNVVKNILQRRSA